MNEKDKEVLGPLNTPAAVEKVIKEAARGILNGEYKDANQAISWIPGGLSIIVVEHDMLVRMIDERFDQITEECTK